MRKKTWSSRARQLTKNLEETWDDLVHDDSSQIEREFNRLVGRLQRRHGYSPDHALNELQNQWNSYSKRTRDVVENKIDALSGRKKKRQPQWLWITLALIGGIYGASKLFRHFAPTASNKQKPAANATPPQKSGVDERSWESFPASDPPATW